MEEYRQENDHNDTTTTSTAYLIRLLGVLRGWESPPPDKLFEPIEETSPRLPEEGVDLLGLICLRIAGLS